MTPEKKRFAHVTPCRLEGLSTVEFVLRPLASSPTGNGGQSRNPGVLVGAVDPRLSTQATYVPFERQHIRKCVRGHKNNNRYFAETPHIPSPVLGIFMARTLSQKRDRPTLKRTESIRAGHGIPLGRKTLLRVRRFSDASEGDSVTPSSPVSRSEMDTKGHMAAFFCRSPWPSTDNQISVPPSPSPNQPGSSPNLNIGPHRNLAPLSVITEASDEDSQQLYYRRTSSKKNLPPLIL